MSTSEFCNGKTNQNLICFEVTNALFRVLIFIYGFVLGEYSRAHKKWIGIVRKPDCVKFIIEIYIAINEFNAINPDAGFFSPDQLQLIILILNRCQERELIFSFLPASTAFKINQMLTNYGLLGLLEINGSSVHGFRVSFTFRAYALALHGFFFLCCFKWIFYF